MDLISDVIKTAQAANNIDLESDYMRNGLLYCGKCDTPKQHRLTGRLNVVVPCMCKCQEEAREKERLEWLEEQRVNRIRQMRLDCFIDKSMMGYTFENDDGKCPELSKVAKRYVENFARMRSDGKGLLFFGTVGTGKTYMAACIANALTDKGIPCLVTNFARLVNTLQGMYSGKQDFIDSLNHYDLLVIDDLSSERDTEYMGEIVQTIIDSRYLSGKPMIATTNLSGEELMHPSDIRKTRVYSRLYQMCVPYEVKGIDRRAQKLMEDDTYRTLLGIE